MNPNQKMLVTRYVNHQYQRSKVVILKANLVISLLAAEGFTCTTAGPQTWIYERGLNKVMLTPTAN